MSKVSTIAIVLALAVACPAQIVINEFVYDDSGGDDREYVELYNAGGAPVDISGWVLEGADEAWSAPLTGDNNADYTIPASTILLAGDYLVIGAATVPNVDVIVGAANLWENSKEAIVLRDLALTVVDAVGYEGNKSTVLDPSLFEGTPIWGNFTSIDATLLSWSRWADGLDTGDNGADFGQQQQSPGTTNDVATMPPTICDDLEQWPVGTDLICVAPSFVVPRVVDPTVVSASVPNPVPASPDGGNCLVFWDPAGGGDAGFLKAPPVQDTVFEAFVYLFVGHTAGESEEWSLGIRGTTGTFYNFPFGSTANGNTGISWTYETNDTGATLRLMDHGSGGLGNVLHSIPITLGANDGWQRIRVEVTGLTVNANFGGVFGDPASGTVINVAASQLQTGTWYMGYREGVVGTANAHGLLVDRINLGSPCPPEYQVNQPAATLTIDGTNGGIYYPAITTISVGQPFSLEMQSTLLGTPFDFLVNLQPLLPASQPPALTFPDGQIVNVDLVTQPTVWFFSPGSALPNLTNAFAPVQFNNVQTFFPVTASGQALFIDPSALLSISLSQGVQLVVQ